MILSEMDIYESKSKQKWAIEDSFFSARGCRSITFYFTFLRVCCTDCACLKEIFLFAQKHMNRSNVLSMFFFLSFIHFVVCLSRFRFWFHFPLSFRIYFVFLSYVRMLELKIPHSCEVCLDFHAFSFRRVDIMFFLFFLLFASFRSFHSN